MSILALDIGGANLKAADGRGYAACRPFELWKQPDGLRQALVELIAGAPPSEEIVATMTGELADCFATKSDGVRAIVAACQSAAAGRRIGFYRTDGTFAPPEVACHQPMLAAAANWHALATFAGRFVEQGCGLLLDIGSTTADIVPLQEGRPAAGGVNDPERLAAGELVYTGVRRSPVCAVVSTLPWRGRPCPVAQELFATTWDTYLLLKELPPEPNRRDTADCRPATIEAAHDRLARMICADRELFDRADAHAAAETIQKAQLAKLGVAARNVISRMPESPRAVVLCGEGEFLAHKLIDRLRLNVRRISLSEELGRHVSRAATAHALAVIAREHGQQDTQVE